MPRVPQLSGDLIELPQLLRLLLRSLVQERDSARTEALRLEGDVVALEDRLADLTDAQQSILARIESRTDANIGALERVLAATGLDVDELLHRIGDDDAAVVDPLASEPAAGAADGVGGPMLPPMTGGLFDDTLERLGFRLARWQALNKVLISLPLATPVKSFRLASGFGNRIDPFTGRRSFHEGLDFSTAFKTPVLATAPGTVVSVGWKGPYGRLVEIEHAFGIRTRYAHLWRTKARVGQEVGLGDVIALAGSSGRSTGVHVHYEILIGDKPVDPNRFVKAGAHVLEE